VDQLAKELKDVLNRIRQAGFKVFIYDDDGMTYSPVVARSGEEAKKKALGGRDDEEWDENHQGLLELNGDPLQ